MTLPPDRRMNHKKLQGPCPLVCEICFRDTIAGYLFAIARDSRLARPRVWPIGLPT
jgi:hypothetical protein